MYPLSPTSVIPKKLLFIVNVDWFFRSHRLPLAVKARKIGFEVHIATNYTKYKDEFERLGLYTHQLSFDRSARSVFKTLRNFYDLFKLLYKIKPDICHLIGMQPIIIGGIVSKLFPRLPIVYAVSGLGDAFNPCNRLEKLRLKLIVSAYSLALTKKRKKVIFQNNRDLSLLTTLTKLSTKDSLLFKGSGVDLDLFSYMPLPSCSSSKFTVLMASRLLHSKGVMIFLEAANILTSKYRNFAFLLAGEPDLENPNSISLEEYSRIKSLPYIQVLGNREDVHSIIHQSHLVVFPSYYPEGLPKVLCEAAACGRPVITTRTPGCSDAVIHGQTGFTVPTHDVNAIVRCIEYLYTNHSCLAEMSKHSREFAVENFSIESIVDLHVKTYFHLIETTC